jgi:type III restriction enzyme
LVDIAREWLRTSVTVDSDTTIGMLLLTEGTHLAAERLFNAILYQPGARQPRLLPILRPFDPEGSTDDVDFFTRKVVVDTQLSHVNRVVSDSGWETTIAGLLEGHLAVAAYVKNDHLGFTIPYVHEGRTYQYLPDFLVRLKQRPEDVERTLIIEVSGGKKAVHSPGPVKAKAETARFQWCAAVNNHGGYGRWGFVEIKDMNTAEEYLDGWIENLYSDGTVTGLRERDDY